VSVWSLAAAVSDIHEESTAPSTIGRLLAREYTYTLAAAALISGLGLAAGLIWVHNWEAAVAAAIGLFVAIAVAGMLGLGLPLALKRARPGPAVGPGRIVVVLATATSLVCFLAVSDLLLRALH
jgi:magnesium transporter